MDKEHIYNSPLVYQRADPYCYKHTDGYYYFTGSVPEYDAIELRRAKELNELYDAEGKIIWRKHSTGPMGAHIWAPELHYINGVWYIYFAAGDAENIWNIRPYALICHDSDPINGRWIEGGKIDVGADSFSLDMTTFFNHGKQYTLWAQTLGEGDNSSVYIAEMKNPLELASRAVSTYPEYEWERRGIPVNEGPAVLKHDGKIFVVYSAANTGANYCMGMLWCNEEDDLLDVNSWHKLKKPVMKSCPGTSQYGPGHNSFTTDRGMDIVIYHSRSYKDIDGDPLYDPNRHARAAVISYDEHGFPVFPVPIADNRK